MGCTWLMGAWVQALKSSNSRLAKAALKHAKQLWDFGAKYPGSFTQSVPEIGAVYPSSVSTGLLRSNQVRLHRCQAQHIYPAAKAALQCGSHYTAPNCRLLLPAPLLWSAASDACVTRHCAGTAAGQDPVHHLPCNTCLSAVALPSEPRPGPGALAQHDTRDLSYVKALEAALAPAQRSMQAWRDDMAWGAAWLHMATGKRWYRKAALRYLQDSRKHEPSRCAVAGF